MNITQFRKNQITGKVALWSKARSDRPKGKTGTECPFCPGNEYMTPPPILNIPEKEGRNSRIRIVPNKYPLLAPGQQGPDIFAGLNHFQSGCGEHEIIIDHAQHDILIHEMGDAHLTVLFSLFQQRMVEMYKNPDIQLVQVFKNFGRDAGGSLPHTHTQGIAIPLVPHNIEMELWNGKKYYRKSGRCIFCSLIDEAEMFESMAYDSESKLSRPQVIVGQFIIERTQHFVALVPFAPSHDYEVWILPLKHHADFLDLNQNEIEDLAGIFRRTMARLSAVIEGLQYNFFIHTVPHSEEYKENTSVFHTHIEIVPRMTQESGFEKSTRIYLLEKNPAVAAENLRNAQI